MQGKSMDNFKSYLCSIYNPSMAGNEWLSVLSAIHSMGQIKLLFESNLPSSGLIY
jgi:hypothetical protein